MTRRRAIRRSAPLLTVAALAAGLAATVAPESSLPAAAAADQIPTIMSLGDSFVSGEGAGWKGNSLTKSGSRNGTDMAAYFSSADGKWHYDPYTVYNGNNPATGVPGSRARDSWYNLCHESLASPIHQVSLPGAKVVNLACSGASNKNIWPLDAGGQHYNYRSPQVDDINPAVGFNDDVKLVTIGAGGNDSGFAAAVQECLGAWAKKHIADNPFDPAEQMCSDEIRDDFIPKITDVYYNLSKTVDEVRAELQEEGEPVGSYRMVLHGAPMILPTEADDWLGAETSGYDLRCPIRKEDAQFINTHFVTRLNEIARAVAEEKGIGFIDLSDAFVGHRLCEYGTLRDGLGVTQPGRAEWVRFLDIHPDAGSVWDLIKTIVDPSKPWPPTGEDLWALLKPQRHLFESFHPNHFGQLAIGKCLDRYYNGTTGNPRIKCVNGGGQTGGPDQMVLTALPAVPHQVDNPAPDVALGQGESLDDAIVRTIVVPDSVKPGHYVQPFVDLSHPRKGQLKVSLVDPDGYSRLLRNYNPSDTSPWVDGRWTIDYHVWSPWVTKDPSGTWKLIIWDGVVDNHVGTVNNWDLKFY